jgi:hypothetical protein
MRIYLSAIVALLSTISPVVAHVGFQQTEVPDPGFTPLSVVIWYPTNTVPKTIETGPGKQLVALGGTVSGADLPLIIMSHGSLRKKAFFCWPA